MKIEPTDDQILIEAIMPSDEKALIKVPDKYKRNELENLVVAVGPGRWGITDKRLPMDVVVGDTILAHRNNGTEILFEGRAFRMIRSDSVLGIVRL